MFDPKQYIPKTVDNVVVKSAWLSPTNIASIAGFLVMVAAAFKIDLDANTAAQGILLTMAVVSAAIHLFAFVRRTWFNKTITPAVAKKL